nr:MAG TPA: Glycine rich protein [Caudoviricetes sp.]
MESGSTKDGATSFPSTSGGTETGHSGNGYCKITVL